MEKFCDFITNLDWWGVILSAISTIAVIAIAYVQIRLQKRQTDAQEYEVRKRLYSLLSNANREIDYFLYKLSNALDESHYNADNEYLQRWLTFVDNLLKDLRESYVDYELKFSKEVFDKNGYLKILSLMSRIVRQTVISLQQGDVCLSRGACRLFWDGGRMDDAYASYIAKHYRGGTLPNIMRTELAHFIKMKRGVRCDDSLLESIRAKCKID